ncbi:MAG TPA: hypothetical protein VG387_14335 [Rhizomicrobium sp.]|jgi:hypothetical protein|nr:hypothetical protein [Rhizomicrobium sp.]
MSTPVPQILSFDGTPGVIDFDQPVTLRWRTADADGLELVVNQGLPKDLPAQSDSASPVVVTPRPPDSYVVRAYAGTGDDRQYSLPAQLVLSYNPPVFVSFTASPQVVDDVHNTVTLNWQVKNAVAATLQGVAVAPSGASAVALSDSTSFTLEAVAVDGATSSASVQTLLLIWSMLNNAPTPPQAQVFLYLRGLDDPASQCTVNVVHAYTVGPVFGAPDEQGWGIGPGGAPAFIATWNGYDGPQLIWEYVGFSYVASPPNFPVTSGALTVNRSTGG